VRPLRVSMWIALASALLAILFLALGHISPEPLDHPQWLMAGYWPIMICYSVLLGWCAPGFALFCLLLHTFRGWGLVAGPDPYLRPGLWWFVIYPLVQGVIYGGAAWMLTWIGNTVHTRFLRHRISRSSLRDYEGGGAFGNCSHIRGEFHRRVAKESEIFRKDILEMAHYFDISCRPELYFPIECLSNLSVNLAGGFRPESLY
jgi:hypothetical protein